MAAEHGRRNMGLTRFGTAAGVALWVWGAPGSTVCAQDEGPEADLSWVRSQGAESCPGPAALRENVSGRLGRDPFGPSAAITIEALVSRDGDEWSAVIHARSQRGELLGTRELESEAPSCESLGEAAALAIALMIDPEAAQRVARSGEKPVPPARPLLPAPEPPSWLDGRALAAVGLLPGLALGGVLSADVGLNQTFDLTAALLYLPEQETRKLDARFAFGLTTLSLGGCAQALGRKRLGLQLCATGLLGSIHAVVYDLEPTAPGDRVWVAAAAEARLHATIGRARISLGALGTLPFTRHRFKAMGQNDTIFRQNVVAIGGLLGLGVGF
jgi:hypothetical protein